MSGAGAVSTLCDGVRLDVTELDSGAGTAYQLWPLQSGLPPLAALPTAPACARGHVRMVAHEWGLQHPADTAELLASETVANAVQASERLRARADVATVPVVLLSLVSDKVSLVIRVWDACEYMPVRQVAGPDELGGRGLLLVETLGSDWGFYRIAGGKVAWVLIS
jgi:anti-sigma regulatory factor (Ser/Thr protein kinase)